ncbi:hypothetical protein ABW20_dc0102701 [Dactylellina cionopaga]|nr:hypothetical protein ABW20_dc0102701 [Dactylellina cionopaga]
MGLEGSEKTASSAPEPTDLKTTDNPTTTIPTQEPAEGSVISPNDKRLDTAVQRAIPGSSTDSEKTAVVEKQEEEETPEVIAEANTAKDEKALTTTEGAEDDDDESKYPSGIPLVILTAGLCLSTFVIALGGAFTDAKNLTWRWCFWINLPIGAVAFAGVLFFFKNPVRKENSDLTVKERIAKIDLLGAFFLICAIVCLLLALQWGGFKYHWNNSKVWGCIIGFGLLIIIFIYIQFREQDNATIPPRIFLKNRTVLSSCTFNSFLSMAIYAHIYFLPFYFQAVRGTSAVQSGIRCIPYLISVTVASIIVGGSVTVIGYYTPFMWASAAIFTVGAGLLHTLTVDSSSGKWIGYQIVAGFGAGMGIQIPFVAVQVVLSSKDMPVGNALAIFFNSLGGAISISIAQNIFSNTLLQELPKLAPNVDPAAVVFAGATGIRTVVSAADLPGVILSYNNAIVTCFILPIAVGGIAFLCSWGMEMKSVKGKKIEMGGGA